MKDYGNAGALCGALGCMVLLLISMHFAKAEDSTETKDASAEVVYDDPKSTSTDVTTAPTNELAVGSSETIDTTAALETSDEFMTETTISEEVTTTISQEVTLDLSKFIGPLTKEVRESIENSTSYPPEVLHLAYPEQLSIVGDSIASGFGVYGALHNSYDFATGDLGARSITDYSFSYGGEMGKYIDVLTASQPAYIYLSMGMNDVNIITSDEYVDFYREIISNVRSACPDSIIIVAGITPISIDSTFTENSNILTFNEKLKALVDELASPTIKFYDANKVVADEATGALRSDCNGGDGIHLSSLAYDMLLENLYPLLDELPVPQVIKDIIEEDDLVSQAEAAKSEEENESDVGSDDDSAYGEGEYDTSQTAVAYIE